MKKKKIQINQACVIDLGWLSQIKVHVFFGEYDKAREYFKKIAPESDTWPKEGLGNGETLGGDTLRDSKTDDTVIFCWIHSFEDPKSYNQIARTIAHESIHVSYEARRILGDLFSPGVQEPQAYLIGHIVKEALDFYREKVLKV